jgi:hypothetical protein
MPSRLSRPCYLLLRAAPAGLPLCNFDDVRFHTLNKCEDLLPPPLWDVELL